MAALPTARLTYADLAKYLDPKGMVAPVVELLAQKGAKELMGYMPWSEGNLPTGHEFGVRTALPTAELVDYNEGGTPSTSKVAQQTEGMSRIQAWAEVDADEADLNGQADAFRAQENKAFVQAVEQKFMDLFYKGNTSSSSKEFNGLSTRLSTLASGNVIDAGGDNASTNTSIFLMSLGDDFFGIYPKGSQTVGWKHEDFGAQIIQSSGTRMKAFVSRFHWTCGIVLRDWRRLVRIANIKVADLRTRLTTQALTASTNILYGMADAVQMLPDMDGTQVFGANRTVIASLAKMGMDKSSSVLDVESGLTQFGKPFQQVKYLGIPIVPIDRILNTEAKVS